MCSLLKPPGGERTFNAALFLLLAVYVSYQGFDRSNLKLIAIGLGWLVAGAGLWLWKDWGRWLAIALLLGTASYWGWDLVGKRLSFAGFIAPVVSLAYAIVIWRDFSPARRKITAVSEEQKPMISFVLLLKEPRFMEARILAEIVSSAWGGEYTSSDLDSEADSPKNENTGGSNRFVVGQTPLFMVSAPEAMYIVNNFDRPYFDNVSSAAEAMPELRLRHAVENHVAWLSVDLIGPSDDEQDRQRYYPTIAKLIAELSGPDCLAIYHPESGIINAWDESMVEKLRGPDALTEFAERVHAPVIQLPDDDPRMQAAVAEARRRWPEFVGAFKAKSAADYAVKAPVTVGEHTEFIWIDVIGLEPEYIHGKLANDPVALEGMKIGDQVEVPVSELNDWFFSKNNEPVGWFTVKVLAEAQKEQAHRRDQSA